MYKLVKPPSLIALLLFLAVFVYYPQKTVAASNIIPSDVYLSGEIAIFLNGEIIITREKTYSFDGIKNSGIYIPLKLLSKIDNISVNYSTPITINSIAGSYKVNNSNSVLYDNTTYLSLKNFYTFTGLSGEYLYEANSLFLWSDLEGQTKTKKLIKQIKSVKYDYLKSFMGQKVYVFEGEKVGWVVEMNYFSKDIFEYKILLTSGKVIEGLVVGERPDSFITYLDYEMINNLYSGKYYWANKNQLPSSNPLLNIEKVYFKSTKIKGSDLVVQANRANGANITFKLSFFNDPSEPIRNGFYTVNPKTLYPKWTSDIWTKISQQKISIGMSQDQVKLSWGSPNDITSYTSSNLRMDQWVYESTYLHFYNGKLESWTDL
ncbi:hypothetical protein SAMN05428961_11089 [Paenibacillus sp. OK060]|uniref:hypothetical protein n=1 Tax=Paenibacillus sp. OK060 TaxID=1881034 RepID=UPI000887BA16|nr:hypothetical protein [Paenibacillus sp. OK060]SDM15430.1 hypothetical protein SAMN05428961_11089 [Paenibacillus sp. OK060]